jgi:hypothetical protein
VVVGLAWLHLSGKFLQNSVEHGTTSVCECMIRLFILFAKTIIKTVLMYLTFNHFPICCISISVSRVVCMSPIKNTSILNVILVRLICIYRTYVLLNFVLNLFPVSPIYFNAQTYHFSGFNWCLTAFVVLNDVGIFVFQ